jgi:hypothetical protein
MAFEARSARRPGIGMAWEPFPGRTPYTKASELMNAETSTAVNRVLLDRLAESGVPAR